MKGCLRGILALLVVLALTGFGSSPPLTDIRFNVVSVSTPDGPASINNDGSANYTFTVSIERTADGQGFIDGTGNTPAIRPGLYVGNTRLAFTEIDFPVNVNRRTVTLTLDCENNEVRGDDGGSGHGAQQGSGFLGWPWFGDDPAQVSAKLNNVRSTGTVSILCN